MSSSSAQRSGGIELRRSKSPSPSQSRSSVDWLGPSIVSAKTIAAATECTPFSCVKGVFGTVVVVLEVIQKVKKNQDDLKDLCANVMHIMHIVQGHLLSQKQTDNSKLEVLCKDFESVLQGVLSALAKFKNKPRGFRERFRLSMHSESVADKINGYRDKIQELRLNFMLMAHLDMNRHLHRLGDALIMDAPRKDQYTNNCPPASRIFLGRQVILDKMKQYFNQDMQKQHIYVLYGLGGAGKTQIALRFIELSVSCFCDIFLIDSSTIETINEGLKNIAVTKNMGTTSEEANQWLSRNKDWLLFFDNADDPKINLKCFLPQYNHGNIIITSRNSGLRVYAAGHSSYSWVPDMEEAEATDLLLKIALQDDTADNRNTARNIAMELHCLPLAIIQAGAFIAKSGNLGNYLGLYFENKTRLLSEQLAQSQDNYEWTVYTTWEISFEQLSPLAAKLLQLCSLLHYEGISEDIFKNASQYTFPAYGPSKEELDEPVRFLSHFLSASGEWEKLKFQEIINEIQSYSLMNFDLVEKVFSMHPLVHDWCRGTIISQETYHSCMVGILGMCIEEIPYQDMPLASLRLQFHLDSLVQGNKEIVPDSFGVQYSRVYQDAGNYNKAVRFRILAVDKCKKLLGDNHAITLLAMAALGKTYWSFGQLGKAKKVEEAVLEKRRQLFGDDHPATLKAMASLGATYQSLGQFEETKKLDQVVLQKQSQLLGVNHPDTLEAMANLGGTYRRLSQFKEAKKLEKIVLEKRSQIFGNNHPETLQAMANLGATCRRLSQFEEAKKLNQVVLQRRKQLLGDNHPKTLEAMAYLGSTYRRLSQFEEAKKLDQVVLQKRCQLFGNNHPDTLEAMANLGATYSRLSQFEKAKQLEKTVLQKRSRLFGCSHPQTVQAIASLGATYGRLAQFDKAKKLNQVVLEKRSQLFGTNHPETLQAMANLGATYRRLSLFEEAKKLEKGVLEKRSQMFGNNHPGTLKAMANLGATYRKLSQFEEAKKLEKVVLEKRSLVFGDNHPDTLRAMASLGATYQSLGHFEEAEKLKKVVLEKWSQPLKDNHPDILEAVANL